MKIRSILMLGWLLGLAAVTGEEAKDPDGAPGTGDVTLFIQEGESSPDPIVRLRLETWEAPALEVAKRLDDIKTSADLEKLRAECLTGPAGVSLVLSSAINVSSPAKVIAESITERIYPTEYEPPELPCGASLKPADEKKPPANFGEWIGEVATHALPTSFDTRNTGTTLEAEVTRIFGEKATWEARIAVDDVRYLGKDSFGPDALAVTMPVFSAFRSTSSLRLKEGQWKLLSVMEPPRGLDSKPSDKRWVTLVRLDLQE